MTVWAQVLIDRSAAKIEAFKAEETALLRVTHGNRSRAQQERLSHVSRACAYGKLSFSSLKTSIPGSKKMFEGSVKMDTGTAFMLVGSHADLRNPADVTVSDRLVELVILARPKMGNVDNFDKDSAVKRSRGP